jgi:hypothetical protein
MRRPKHFVLNEHTLGYIYDEMPTTFCVLHGSVLKGGHDWKNGPITLAPGIDKLRPATKADFDEYRVSWKGHLEDGE